MAKPTPPRTIERRIYFYRIDAGNHADGTPVALDLRPHAAKAAALGHADPRRRWDQPDGNSVAIWPGGAAHGTDCFSFATRRASGLPQSEEQGRLAALQLGVGAGLHEAIHVRTFPSNLIGVEFNFYGPRISRLADYLRYALGSEAPDFVLDPLLQQDTAKRLKQQGSLRVLELTVRPSYIATIEQLNGSVGLGLRSLEKLSGAGVVGLVLKPELRQRTNLKGKIFTFAKKLAKRTDLQDNAERFLVKGVGGPTGRVESIDLLSDHLVSKQEVLTLDRRSRAVQPASAFTAIQKAYLELRPELERAAAISAA